MDLSMSENSNRALSTAKVAGRVRKVLNQAINMKVITSTTRSMAMACSLGPAGTNIKVSTEKMNVMVMVK
jgi:hypothetical protein